MNLIKLKLVLKNLVLRGPILKLWVMLKIKTWQKKYLRKLANKSLEDESSQKINPLKLSLTSKKLNNLLILTDEMWEKQELVPELHSLVKTHLIDIKKHMDRTSLNFKTIKKEIKKLLGDKKSCATLIYLNSEWLSEELFSIMRNQTNGPLLGLNLDDKAEFFNFGPGASRRQNYSRWIGRFDLNLSDCKAFKAFYENQGGKFYYCPPGLHIPDHFSLPKKGSFKRKNSFLGSAKPERVHLIRSLIKLGIQVETFGHGWPSSKWITNARSIFRETQINLGIGFASGSTKIVSLKARDFECPGIGACYLTTYNFELCDHWKLGEEILCYRSFEELVEMFAYYNKKPDLCLKIAQRAFVRAKNEHTWRCRFKEIFRYLGILS